ncbi:MAG: 16S rRNA (uracil(1498)-N(3))-methyltransferase [Clostridiales bacterium]|nr:16S rRNA (uracil(1498)-N(3))-methyltransferase [Clostridiales bacterium]
MRFYVNNIKSPLELTGDAHTHAAYSLRVRVGDYITVFDGKGVECSCKVTSVNKDKTCLEIIDTRENVGETKTEYSLYLSVIKQDRFELAVQKATELGVSNIIPVYSSYTQRVGNLNIDRLHKIAISACEQCGRSKVPTIEQPIEFDELLERTKHTHMIFPWEREMHGSLMEAIDNSKSVSVFVGPEGGITEQEKIALVNAGAHSVTLGPRILRAETAAITTLSVICCAMGEWSLD